MIISETSNVLGAQGTRQPFQLYSDLATTLGPGDGAWMEHSGPTEVSAVTGTCIPQASPVCSFPFKAPPPPFLSKRHHSQRDPFLFLRTSGRT